MRNLAVFGTRGQVRVHVNCNLGLRSGRPTFTFVSFVLGVANYRLVGWLADGPETRAACEDAAFEVITLGWGAAE